MVFSTLGLAILLSAFMFITRESPAAPYMRAACDAISSNPLSGGFESNEKLLNRLNENLNLARKADEKETVELKLFVGEFKQFINDGKELDAQFRSAVGLGLTLGILNGSGTDGLDSAIDIYNNNSKEKREKLDQKTIQLKNTSKSMCEKWTNSYYE